MVTASSLGFSRRNLDPLNLFGGGGSGGDQGQQGAQDYYGMSLPNYGGAEATQQALTRRGFSTWVNTFMPYEDSLIEYATDPTQAATAMQSARQDVAGAFDNQAAATERRLRPLGGLNADEQTAATRSLSLARATASVGAQNRARDLTLQRQQSILGGLS